MPSPFPGMDPYLEHPVLWEGFHARLVVAIANHLQPRLDPRYVASVEERVYLACVNRWPRRNRYELFPMRLREPLAEVQIPLSAPDPDVPLPLQEVFNQVYEDGRYYRRVRYEDPHEPPLADDDQNWAWDCWNQFHQSHPELFPA